MHGAGGITKNIISTSREGCSEKPCIVTIAEEVSLSAPTEPTGIEMTFISATKIPATTHLNSTLEYRNDHSHYFGPSLKIPIILDHNFKY